ncbi:hypothetical protein [Paraburkholderia sp. C35]|uniref:hypothetical protein n=1 Tax=Paraburkholderia sp. C35 TaxID=2126993 RepID=UPI001EF4CFE4|nr:hypothetical protein [Paraburkholderia sp. C35]
MNNEVAFVSFYDETTAQIKFCLVSRSAVQGAIDNALVMTVPPDASEHSVDPITDEDARKLGGMALLCHGKAHPELLGRLKIATEAPLNWTQTSAPGSDS